MKIQLRKFITEADGVLQFIDADGLSDKVYIKNLKAFLKEQSDFKRNRYDEDNFKDVKVMSDIRDRGNNTAEEKAMDDYNKSVVYEYNDKDQLISKTDETNLNGSTTYFAESTTNVLLQEKAHDDNENLSKSRIKVLRDKQKKYEDAKNTARAKNMKNSADTIQNNRDTFAQELNNSRKVNESKMSPEERDLKRARFVLRFINKMDNSTGGKFYNKFSTDKGVAAAGLGTTALGGLAGYMSADDSPIDAVDDTNKALGATAGTGLGYLAGAPIIAGGLAYGQKLRMDKLKEAQARANKIFK